MEASSEYLHRSIISKNNEMQHSVVFKGNRFESLIAWVDLLPPRDFAQDVGLLASQSSFLQNEVAVIILSS